MNFLSNAHTHTTYCDGISSISEMIDKAQALGFVSLGFSGHAAQGFDGEYSMMGGRQLKYRSELRRLQESFSQHAKAPRLWVGLELDALATDACKRDAYENFDYVIGSTHYLCKDFRGECVAVDGDPKLLRRYVDEAFSGDGLQMACAYFDIQVNALLADKPMIIGHFDVVRKYAKSLNLFDENGAEYRRLALKALERACYCGGVLELNTGSIARGYMDAPYPTEELLGAWREMGGAVTVTTDCHDASYLDFGMEEALKMVKRAGFSRVTRLGVGDALWDEIKI